MFYSGISDESGKDIETQIKAHKELGWRHIEVRGAGKANLTDLDDAEFQRVAGLVKNAGLQISCYASQIANWSRKITGSFDTDVAELKRAIPRMKQTGTPFIRIMSFTNDNLSDEEWGKEAIRRIRELARMAEDGGVTLVHENCSGWAGQGSKQTLQLLEQVNSPALKLVWDTGNPVSHKTEDLPFFMAVRQHVVYVHIKDGCRAPTAEGGNHTWPGEGDSQVKATLKQLFADGYDGGLSIEPHMKAVVHLAIEPTDAAAAYGTYVEYGKRLMKLVESVRR